MRSTTYQKRLALSMSLLLAGSIFLMAVLVLWNAAVNVLQHYEAMAVAASSLATRYARESAALHEEELQRATQNMTRAKINLQEVLRSSGAVPPGQSWEAFQALLDRSLKDLLDSVLPPFSLREAVRQLHTRLDVSRVAVLDEAGQVVEHRGFAGEAVDPRIAAMARRVLAAPEAGPASRRFGREIGVVTRLELPNRAPLALYLQHRVDHGLALMRNTLLYVAFFTAVMIAGSLLVAWRVSRQLSKGIGVLTEGVRRIREGHLDYPVSVETRDEIQEVAQAMGEVAGNLRTAMDELEQETLRRERLEHELHIASELQLGLLPEGPPAMPGLDLLGWSRPAKEVGGDFYDFLELGPNRLGVAIGDASGKGLPAALLVTECWSVFRTLAEELPEPADLLYRVNNALSRRVRATGRFVTLFFMVVDVERGRLSYASAGHNPPLLVGAREDRMIRLAATDGFPLGIVSGSRYSQHEIALEAGDTLLLYSDGLTEAQDPQGQLYGERRVRAMIKELGRRPLLELLAGVKQDMDDHIRDADIFDDVTLVGLRYAPPRPAP